MKPAAPLPKMRSGSADVAQLVEHHLAKVGVAGSSPVVRSRSDTVLARAESVTLAVALPRRRRKRSAALGDGRDGGEPAGEVVLEALAALDEPT